MRLVIWVVMVILLGGALRVMGGSSATTGISAPTNPALRGTAAHVVVGLSPFLEREDKDPLYRALMSFVLEQVDLGVGLEFVDAYHLKTIARIEVPSLSAFRSAKTRAKQFAEPLARVRRFLGETNSPPEWDGTRLARAVRLPHFLDWIATRSAPAGKRLDVLLFGSPLYIDVKEPGFSMRDGYYPCDSHLVVARERSLYGHDGNTRLLSGCLMHLGYFGDPWRDRLHEEKIIRFWGLYAAQRGARIGLVTGDLASLFAAPTRPPDEGWIGEPRWVMDSSTNKLEMIRDTRTVDHSDWITRELSEGAATEPPAATRGRMKIGIRWSGPLDLDLHATDEPGGEVLAFDHVRGRCGYYFKDHRQSPDREYEFVEFEVPVDLWKVEAQVNLYAGASDVPVEGEARIEFLDRIYTAPFRLAARSGNEARTGAGQEAYWARLDIPGMLRLRKPGAELNRDASKASRR